MAARKKVGDENGGETLSQNNCSAQSVMERKEALEFSTYLLREMRKRIEAGETDPKDYPLLSWCKEARQLLTAYCKVIRADELQDMATRIKQLEQDNG